MTALIESSAVTDAAVVGAGPAGLMAAQVLADAGHRVRVLDAMPSAGRKFLLAGKGGLNLTHAEALDDFIHRYGDREPALAPMLRDFGPDAVRAWASGLGIDTFVGTSRRVFPTDLKAAPLLRAWLHRLRHPADPGVPVQFHMRHRWTGWGPPGPDGGPVLRLMTPEGERALAARAVVLALGGASWARLGSDGAWVPWLAEAGAAVAPLRPANCGFDVAGRDGQGWTPLFRERWAGQPFKSVAVRVAAADGRRLERRGEFVATATGVEGSLVYAASALLRDTLAQTGRATLVLDLLPDRDAAQVLAGVAHPRGSRSLSSHLKSRLGLDGIKMALLHELLSREVLADPARLAVAIKGLPVELRAPRPVDEAISTAGGVDFASLDPGLMLRTRPGVFCAGEMLDWEAPTGGYLLTACLSTGRHAGAAAARWLEERP